MAVRDSSRRVIPTGPISVQLRARRCHFETILASSASPRSTFPNFASAPELWSAKPRKRPHRGVKLRNTETSSADLRRPDAASTTTYLGFGADAAQSNGTLWLRVVAHTRWQQGCNAEPRFNVSAGGRPKCHSPSAEARMESYACCTSRRVVALSPTCRA